MATIHMGYHQRPRPDIIIVLSSRGPLDHKSLWDESTSRNTGGHQSLPERVFKNADPRVRAAIHQKHMGSSPSIR